MSARSTVTADSSLVIRNVTINGTRTSMRLEPAFWSGLAAIAGRQRVMVDVLVSRIARSIGTGSLASAVRVYVVEHFRSASQAEEQIAAIFSRPRSQPRHVA